MQLGRDALTPQACAEMLGVSRETLPRLQAYLDLLARWQARINLVGASTLADPWRRHVLDCGQLHAFLPVNTRVVVDLGSGAGLPGLVLAIMGVPEVHLIESDKRKATFLREAARTASVTVTVHACRVADAPSVAADVITARALAPLPELLALATQFLSDRTTCLFLKGRRVDAELTAARESWTMQVSARPSRADREGKILILHEVHRAIA